MKNRLLEIKRISIVSILELSIILGGIFVSCGGSSGRPSKKDQVLASTNTIPTPASEKIYNIWIENSGSMKGYFHPNLNSFKSARTILKNLYDRIDERIDKQDTITLNYINTKIVSYPKGIEDYLNETYNKCVASHTNIDDILRMAIEGAKNSCVNLFISDYILSSDNGNFSMAQSDITNLITKCLRENENLTVAILKYEAEFKGKYYPSVGSGIQCDEDRPLYVWAFGDIQTIKEFIELPNLRYEHIAVLQPHSNVIVEIQSNNARMTRKRTPGVVVVKEWKKNRINDDYSLKFTFSTQNIALDKLSIIDKNSYSLTSGYYINDINNVGKDIYEMIVTTTKPSPGKLRISIPCVIPYWIQDSNFEGQQIPPIGKTEGFRYLVGGVYDAYNNKFEDIISLNINLE